MKKTISMLLAVLMAAVAVCSFSVIGFADETTAAANDDPVDSFVTEATKAPATEAATKAPATTEAATKAPEATAEATKAPEATAEATTEDPLKDFINSILTTKSAEEVSKENEAEEIVTRAPGQTVVVDNDETTKAPVATKKPAKVESNIPSTGSSFVPAIALLALAAGTVAVVKTKKED